MEEFILGVPPDLKKGIEEYHPKRGSTNVYRRDLRKSVIGYARDEDTMEIDGIPAPPSEDRYIFFPKTEKSISFTLGGGSYGFFVALDPDKYGFPDEESIRIKPRKVSLKLSSSSEQEYSSLVNSREISANKLLDKVGAVVNNSMKYSFERLRKSFEKKGADYSAWVDVEKNSGYAPKGDEVEEGFCVDAGEKIRNILGHLNMEKNYCFSKVAFVNSEHRYHDATLVFNKNTGNWALINSKSPTKTYNLVPKEKLSELGDICR